jgi:hypothetical protein
MWPGAQVWWIVMSSAPLFRWRKIAYSAPLAPSHLPLTSQSGALADR